MFSFAVTVLGVARREMLVAAFGIIVHSHHAGMCVRASHYIVAYRRRINS